MPVLSSEPWPAPNGPKVDDGEKRTGPDDGELAARYEAVRAATLSEGTGRAGLGAGLLMAKGMAAWMRGWQACTPPPAYSFRPVGAAPSAEVVAVLAAMALGCTEGG